MTETTPNDPTRRWLAYALIVGGVIVLVALCGFVWLAIGFRLSFTSSLPPMEDLALGFAALSPVALLALGMIWFGRRLLRHA